MNKLFVSPIIRIVLLLTSLYAPVWCSDDEYEPQLPRKHAVYTQQVPCDEEVTVAVFKNALALALRVKQAGMIQLIFNGTNITNSQETFRELGIVNASHIEVVINKGHSGRPKKVKISTQE